MRVRRSAALWNESDWKQLSEALGTLRVSRKYTKHAQRFRKGPAGIDLTFMYFESLPWHRRFIFDFETDLQVAAQDCDLTLPYWSACMEAGPGALAASSLWDPGRMGGRPQCGNVSHCSRPRVTNGIRCGMDPERWCIGDGIASDWMLEPAAAAATGGCECVARSPGEPAAVVSSCATVLPSLRLLPDLKALSAGVDAIIATLHCGAAVGKKSTLCTRQTAPWDPLFWLSYAFLDRLFFAWQRYHSLARDVDTSDCYGCEINLTYYQQPIAEWLGRHDAKYGCILLPRSRPVACVSYAGIKN